MTRIGLVLFFISSNVWAASPFPVCGSSNSFTGPAYFADGAVGAPSITFIADTNTGIYRVGADIVGFTTGGVQRMTIQASGQTFCGTGTATNECITQTFGNTSNIVDVSTSTGVTSIDYGSLQLACGSADLSNGDLTSVDDIYGQAAKTSDAATDASTIKLGQDAYWGASGATNVLGGSTTISGGIGTRKVVCSSFGATTAGDTLAITVTTNGTPATTTLTARNGGAVANEWNCTTSANECCTNLYNYLVANPITGIASVSNATAGTVGFVPQPYVSNIYLLVGDVGSGAVFGAATNALSGGVIIQSQAYAPTTLQEQALKFLSVDGTIKGGISAAGYPGGIKIAADSSGSGPLFMGTSMGVLYGNGQLGGIIFTSNATANNIDLSMGDIKTVDDIYGAARATDAAPQTMTISPQQVVVTPGATNTTGASIVLSPGMGARTITATGITIAATTGDTITIVPYFDGAALTTCTKTEGDGTGGTFDCDGAGTQAQCLANLAAVYVATPCTGVTVTSTATAMTFAVTPGTSDYLTVVSSDNTNLPVTSGADGSLKVSGGTLKGYCFSNTTANRTILYRGDCSTAGFLESYSVQATNFYTNAISRAVTGPQVITGGQTTDAGTNTAIQVGSYREFLTAGAKVFQVFNNTLERFFVDLNGTFSQIFPKGQTTNYTYNVQSVAFAADPGDASKTITGLIPLGATLLSVTGRAVTPTTNCTTCKVGLDMGAGLDDDMLAALWECDVNDTLLTTATATANWVGGCLKAGGCDLVVTGNGGNCFGGSLAFTATYLTATAATAD